MREKVLIVEDMEINREILVNILEDEYDILQAKDGIEAMKVIDQEKEDIVAILLDLVMPNMDGYEVMSKLKEQGLMKKIPVLVISASNQPATEAKCLEFGVADFIGKPFDSSIVKKRVRNVAYYYVYKNDLEDRVDEQTARLRKQNKMLEEQAAKLKKINENIIDMLGAVVEYRSLESGQHVQRVKGYTRILGTYVMNEYPEYNLTESELDVIVTASALHDVGKVAIPDSILLKPGRLTDEEFMEMKEHTIRGCRILEEIKELWSGAYGKASYDICRHHHERYDGRGYPDGIAGEDIPISAQLVAIADVYDALTNDRCYKKAFTPDEAYEMITNGQCGTFSAKILKAFEKTRDEFERLAKEVASRA